MKAVQVSDEILRFESEGCRLMASEAIGRIASEGGKAEWALKFDSTAPLLFHLPVVLKLRPMMQVSGCRSPQTIRSPDRANKATWKKINPYEHNGQISVE